MNAEAHRRKARYEAVEHFFGVACPLLGALSVLDHWGLLGWMWLLFLWMSCGHYALYLYDACPVLKYRPFVKGLFVFGVGLLWPVWLAARGRDPRLRG